MNFLILFYTTNNFSYRLYIFFIIQSIYSSLLSIINIAKITLRMFLCHIQIHFTITKKNLLKERMYELY